MEKRREELLNTSKSTLFSHCGLRGTAGAELPVEKNTCGGILSVRKKLREFPSPMVFEQ